MSFTSFKCIYLFIINLFLVLGEVQEEEEKEAQETWQKKEKEGNISVGL